MSKDHCQKISESRDADIGIERSCPTIGLAVLTYQRNRVLRKNLETISAVVHLLNEVIVVDNCSTTPAAVVCENYPWVTLIRSDRNMGAAGRNLAFSNTKSDVLITLDDDVMGLRAEHIQMILDRFKDPQIAAVNFRVTEDGTGKLVNWVHHRDSNLYSNTSFDTYEITEGAVAFRVSAIAETGGYPEKFFLSHEGPDLAFRIINRQQRVIYAPEIVVTHEFAPESRATSRNYYFDTRNAYWLAARNFPLLYGIGAVSRQVAGTLFFSVRDGFLLTWLKATCHGIAGLRWALKTRQSLSPTSMRRIKEMDSERLGLIATLRRKLRSSITKLD